MANFYRFTATFIQPDTQDDNSTVANEECSTRDEAIGAALYQLEQDLRDNGFEDDVVAAEIGLAYLDIQRNNTHLNSQSEIQYSIALAGDKDPHHNAFRNRATLQGDW